MDKVIQKIVDLEMKVVFLIGLAMMALYWIMFFDNGEKIEAQITATDTQIQEQATKKIETNKVVKELEELLVQKKQIQDSTLKFYDKFPQVLSSSEITKHIQELVGETQAKIKQFKPGVAIESNIFLNYPIGIVVEGSFGDLALFVYKLSKTNYIFKIKELSITSKNIQDEARKIKEKDKNTKVYDKSSLTMTLDIDAMSLPKEKRL